MSKIKTVKCPLCNSELELKKYADTYIWVCRDCPAILVEFHDYHDINNLKRYVMSKH